MKYAQAWQELSEWVYRQWSEAAQGPEEDAYAETLAKIDRLEDKYE